MLPSEPPSVVGIQHSVQGGKNTFPMHSALRILHAVYAQRCAAQVVGPGCSCKPATTLCTVLQVAELPGDPQSALCSSAPALSPLPGHVYGTGEHN